MYVCYNEAILICPLLFLVYTSDSQPVRTLSYLISLTTGILSSNRDSYLASQFVETHLDALVN